MRNDVSADEKVTCPLCGRVVEEDPLHDFSVEYAAAHFCPSTRDADRNLRLEKNIRKLWGGSRGKVFLCGACEFGFGWPHVGGDEEFYQILHESSGYPGWRWEYGIALENAEGAGMQEGKVLDIGSGDGAFLRRFSTGWERYATEGSETTRKKLRDDGIECFTSLEAALETHAQAFDLITLFQVLEHISEFKKIVNSCFELLKPGGVLVISVPNGATLFEYERLTGCPDMIPGHVNKFSPKALNLVLEGAGFASISNMVEPSGVRRWLYSGLLITKGQAAKSADSFAAKAWGVQNRWLRLSLLSLLCGINLTAKLRNALTLARGGALVAVATKPLGRDGVDPENV